MNTKIDLAHSQFIEMPYFNEEDAKSISQLNKGWSLSYVYNFSEIRDVFVALKKYDSGNIELTKFFLHSQSINLPFVKTKWNKRRLLEHLNALKNFGLIDSEYKILKDDFVSDIGMPLANEDFSVFRRIYFSYFRFKEILSWFFDPSPPDRISFVSNITEYSFIKSSLPLFAFSNKSRFTDAFIYELNNNTDVYYIDSTKNEDLMRFWDVFIKWGTELGILEKFNLKNLEIKTINDKSIACVYAIDDDFKSLDLLQYLNANYTTSYVYLPSLVLELATKFRQKIETIHELIISQYKTHKDFFSFERTSEVFVKKQDINRGDKIFFPKYKDSYISHLIVRK